MDLDAVECDFTRNVQVLLHILVFDTAKILAKMHVEQPVHRLDRPLQARVAKQFFGAQFTAGNVIMPFARRPLAGDEACVDRPDSGQPRPSLLAREPACVACRERSPGFEPSAVLWFEQVQKINLKRD